MAVATTTDPSSAPSSGSPATSRPAAAPVKASSAVPCTAKARSRMMTSGPISPAVMRDQSRRDQGVADEGLRQVVGQRHGTTTSSIGAWWYCALPTSACELSGRPDDDDLAADPQHVDVGLYRSDSRAAVRISSGVPDRPTSSDDVEDRSTTGSIGLIFVGHE